MRLYLSRIFEVLGVYVSFLIWTGLTTAAPSDTPPERELFATIQSRMKIPLNSPFYLDKSDACVTPGSSLTIFYPTNCSLEFFPTEGQNASAKILRSTVGGWVFGDCQEELCSNNIAYLDVFIPAHQGVYSCGSSALNARSCTRVWRFRRAPDQNGNNEGGFPGRKRSRLNYMTADDSSMQRIHYLQNVPLWRHSSDLYGDSENLKDTQPHPYAANQGSDTAKRIEAHRTDEPSSFVIYEPLGKKGRPRQYRRRGQTSVKKDAELSETPGFSKGKGVSGGTVNSPYGLQAGSNMPAKSRERADQKHESAHEKGNVRSEEERIEEATGLGIGAIVGIGLGVLAAVGIVAFVVSISLGRRRSKKAGAPEDEE